MSSPPFVHLHCHSHYSLLDGASQIPELVSAVKALGMPAVALTDHGNLYGAVEFLREAKAAGIMPIVGLEAYVAPGRRTERAGGGGSRQGTRLPPDPPGPERAPASATCMRLSSLSFLEGFYYKPRIDKEILERHSEGLICLSGCASAEFSDLILHGKTGRGRAALRLVSEGLRRGELLRRDPEQRRGQIQHDCAEGAIDIAGRMGLPLVATSDAHYLTREDAAAHDVLLCINTGKTLDDPDADAVRARSEFYVRSPDEMYAAMPGHEEALATSARIADAGRAELRELRPGQAPLPLVHPARGQDARGLPPRALRGRPARPLRRRPRPRGRASGSTTSWASSTGWGSPRTS